MAGRRSGIDSDFVFELPAVAEPAVSPDGTSIVYVRSLPNPETREGQSWLERVPFAARRRGESARRLTSGPADRRPAWSPDGAWIAFLRRQRPDDRESPEQVWLLPADGGEARRLTSLHHGVTGFAWAPDGSWLVSVSDVDPGEDAAERDGTGDANERAAQPPPRPRRVTRIYYRADGVGWRGDRHRQLFRVDARTGEARQLTRGDYDCATPAVSPDGERIAFFSSERSARRGHRVPGHYELCSIAASGGRVRRLVRNRRGVGSIAWSPDGEHIAFASAGGEESFGQSALWLVSADGGEPQALTGDDLQPGTGNPPLVEPPSMHWSGSGILFHADARGSSGLYRLRMPARGEPRVEPVRTETELATALSFAADGRRAGLAASTPRRPAEIVAIETGGGAHTVTGVSQHYLREHPPGRTERLAVRRDEMEIECWLTFPPNFDRSKRYPLVLEIHGGPHGFYGNGWYPLHQLLASAGFLVLAANPRGSATYGHDFLARVIEDWGGEDYLDLMAAIDRVVQRPYVDERRLGVHGYSYGGFMTAWIVGHSDRFRAAVVGAPVINLVSMYGTTDIATVFGETEWGGTPWERFEHYVARSPLTYAPNVQTPVLLLHGELDIRCPVAQSEEYYVTLKRLGKTVEFVRFPGGYHGFVNGGHPEMRRAYYDEVVGWFERWLT